MRLEVKATVRTQGRYACAARNPLTNETILSQTALLSLSGLNFSIYGSHADTEWQVVVSV